MGPTSYDRFHFTFSPPWRGDAPFVRADVRWPNGSWPGEKTPYFPAKTGHMARHGIWPSDRICLRWADVATAWGAGSGDVRRPAHNVRETRAQRGRTACDLRAAQQHLHF